MAGNQSILDMTIVPDPVGGICYIVKNNTDYRISAGGAGGLATLGSDGKLLAAQVPAQSITVTWASVSGKPTTISGYGITDAVSIAGAQTIGGVKTFSSTIVGSISGNAATAPWTGITGKPTTFAPAAHSAALITSGTIDSARVAGAYTDFTSVTGTGTSTFGLFRATGAGSAATPSYAWASDTNTGIYNSAADQLTITTGGTARVTANSSGLTVAGAISATGNITGYSSDRRLKTNIKNISFPMDKLFRIGGYTFSWDLAKCNEVGFLPDNTVEHGVIAQEVQKIVPDAVSAAAFDPEYLTVNYARLVPLLIECIKELNNRLDRLESESE